ncbi:L,D-transpeptidase [Spirillospora sp. NPDC049652]
MKRYRTCAVGTGVVLALTGCGTGPGTSSTGPGQALPSTGGSPSARPSSAASRPQGSRTASVADITPLGAEHETVGVGFPIIVTFSRPVTERTAVENALEVRAERPVEGAWRWLDARTVVYRTRTYWSPHQKVRFTARLTGVRMAKGVYGAKDVTRTFAVGASQISIVDTRRHQMTVRRDGKVARRIPISAGRGGHLKDGTDVYLTASGVHLVMEKERVARMTSAWMGVDPKSPQGYDEQIPWAVRITRTGEYVHQSDGAYQFLGVSNQSHGCVRATPAGARWFFGIAHRGDVVEVTGTARRLDWRNGWSFWQLPWDTWRASPQITS